MTDLWHPSEQDPDLDSFVVVGRILAPWGIRGDVKVAPLTDVPHRFSPGSRLYLEGRPVTVQRSRPHKGALLVKLDTVPDRNAAEALRGKYLAVPAHRSPPLPPGTYYHHQIIGLAVVGQEGQRLGHVEAILNTPGHDVYVVRRPEGDELLLPAVSQVVVDVDLEAGRMTVAVPEGLL